MIERLKTFLIVSALALVVWLFAESESLGEAQLVARIEVAVAEQDRDELRVMAQDFEGRATLSLRGSKASIDQARALLDSPIRLEPGMPEIPDRDGSHDVRLLEALQAYGPLRATGVTLEVVRPSVLSIRVDRLTVVELPIVAQVSGVRTEGQVVVTPPTARVRLPINLASEFRDATASVGLSVEGSATPPGPRRESVAPDLPPALVGAPGVSLLTKRVSLDFTVSSTLETQTFPSAPVQVLLPPIEMEDWRVVINQEEQFLSVELRGPREVLGQLAQPDQRIVAVLALSDVELASGIDSKPLAFGVLKDGVIGPIPANVEVIAERRTVGFRIERREALP